MNTITTVKAREAFSEVLNRSAFGKERIILTRRGKGIVAVVRWKICSSSKISKTGETSRKQGKL